MKRTSMLLGITLLCGAGAVPVAALAAPVTMTIGGSIKVPACTPDLKGTIAYGDIPRSQLSETNYTMLKFQRVKLEVKCINPTVFAIKVTDRRADSVLPASETPSFLNNFDWPTHGFSRESHLGLGKEPQTQNSIGVYFLMVEDVLVDGRRQYMYANTGKGGDTAGHMNGWWYDAGKQTHFGATSALSRPLPGKDFTFAIGASAVLAKAGAFPAGVDVNLDGNASLEIVYL